MYLPARPQQRVKIVSRDGGGKSYNLDIVTRVKQPSAARTHDAGHQYSFPVGRHARPRPENAIALRIGVLQAESMDKFEELVPGSARNASRQWRRFKIRVCRCSNRAELFAVAFAAAAVTGAFGAVAALVGTGGS